MTQKHQEHANIHAAVGFKDDDYHSAVAKIAEEARKLIETGFEYVCTTPENLMLFRKRK